MKGYDSPICQSGLVHMPCSSGRGQRQQRFNGPERMGIICKRWESPLLFKRQSIIITLLVLTSFNVGTWNWHFFPLCPKSASLSPFFYLFVFYLYVEFSWIFINATFLLLSKHQRIDYRYYWENCAILRKINSTFKVNWTY